LNYFSNINIKTPAGLDPTFRGTTPSILIWGSPPGTHLFASTMLLASYPRHHSPSPHYHHHQFNDVSSLSSPSIQRLFLLCTIQFQISMSIILSVRVVSFIARSPPLASRIQRFPRHHIRHPRISSSHGANRRGGHHVLQLSCFSWYFYSKNPNYRNNEIANKGDCSSSRAGCRNASQHSAVTFLCTKYRTSPRTLGVATPYKYHECVVGILSNEGKEGVCLEVAFLNRMVTGFGVLDGLEAGIWVIGCLGGTTNERYES